MTIGSEAFRSVCTTRRRGDTPLAFMNSVWSLRITSRIAERVRRTSDAKENAPRAMAGSTRCSQPPCPNGGNQSSRTEKKRTSRMASQNDGTD